MPSKKKILQSTEKPRDRVVTTTDSNVPAVWIEDESSSIDEYPDIIEPDFESDVEILGGKEVWKPVLVFENRTQATTESSVIMKINKKKVDVDLFNIEAAPFEEGKVHCGFKSWYS